MRCDFCGKRAGLLRRTCPICAKVVEVVEQTAGRTGLTQMVDLFAEAGLSREQVDLVLDAQIGDRPTIRDRLTSNMANALMRNLGMPGRQSAEDVRRVRTAMGSGAGAGTWTGGQRPPDSH